VAVSQDLFLPDEEPRPAETSDVPTPRMLTWAKNSTIYRLGRQMLTEKQLFDAIRRKAKEKFDGISEPQIRACAEFAVKFGYEVGGLDDKSYAEVATRSSIRSGRSKRAIAQRLAHKGIARETAAAALEETDDLYAAVVLARKRAFGPFRKVELDEKRMSKELATFARGGFGFDLAKKVFNMSLEDAEEILADRRV
jgi:regulatory protein